MNNYCYFSEVGILVTTHPELLLPILKNTIQKITAMEIKFRLYIN